MKSIPIPDIIALDGCQNAASYFPSGKAKPDIGIIAPSW